MRRKLKKSSVKKGKAKLGTRENPYKVSMKIKGRSFVKDDAGEWHEMDENGNLIPDHLVKPV